MKRILFLILFIPLACIAQEFNFQFEPEGIPVEIDGWQPFCPWVGGYSESAPDFCDIDADGDLDLFVGEFMGWVSFFENVGDSSTPEFNLVERQYDSLLVVQFGGRANPDFYDLDNDGDYDVLIGSGRVTFVENLGNSSIPCFLSNRDTLYDNAGNWVFGTHISIVDIDADGDGDLICGEYQSHLQFYQNVGTPDSFAFYLEDDNWIGINVGGYADPTLIDIDSDNDLDLFIGEEYGKIWYYRNDGDSVNYDFVYVTDNFEGIDVGDFASPEFADVDGDGDYDLFVGREYDYPSNPKGDIYFYKNIGTQTNPQYQYITKNYIAIDEGCFSFPQFVDMDAEGDLDLVINSGDGLKLFENIGDSVAARFQLVEENFQNIDPDYPFTYFVDIDADDDFDLFAGQSVIPGPPTVALYINEGTPEIPDLVLFNSAYISNPDFHVNVNPVLVDIDADGDQDLIISDDLGAFYYYQNDGTAENPRFTFVTSQWQGIYFSYPQTGCRGFCFGDLDNDEDLDLLMRNIWQIDFDNLRFYRNTGTIYNPVMTFETNVFLPDYNTWNAWPYLSDIDNDNDLDLFTGGYDGGIMFFRNLEVNSVNREPGTVNRSFSLLPNYPNPFNAFTTIPFTIPTASMVKIEVYNLLGQKVAVLLDCRRAAGSYQLTWNAGMYSSGVYLISLESESIPSQARKVILLK